MASHDLYPQEILQVVLDKSCAKAQSSIPTLAILSILAGGYIGFGSGQAQVVCGPAGAEPELPDMGVDVGSRDAVDAAHDEAVRAGHEVVYGPVDEPWGVRRFFVRDPNGVVLSVLAHD